MGTKAIQSHLRLLPLCLALVLVGCNTIQPVKNVSGAPIATSKANLTLDDVRDAIKRAGSGLDGG